MNRVHPIFASFRAILGLISTLGLSVLLYTANSDAAQVTLAWNDPNTSGLVAGYNIHYGTASGQYGSTQDAGTNNPATVPGLANGTTYCFVATAYDRSGSESAFSNQVCTTTPVSTPPLSITTTSLVGGTVGVPYSVTLTATGGTAPYTWSIASGSLPSSLTVNPATGAIGGTPGAAGTANFTVQVTDSANPAVTTTQALSITVAPDPAPAPAPLQITTTSPLPSGTLKVTYSVTLAASGGTPPYTWSITSGALPAGLSLNTSTGAITGTPTKAVTKSPTIRVTDSATPVVAKTTKVLSITVAASAPAPLQVTTTSLPSGTQKVAYSATLAASGGKPSYTWSVASGTLPAGLSLSTGAITGTPTTAGTWSFTIRVTDSASPAATTTQGLSITVAAPLQVTTTSLPSGTQKVAYSATLAASGGKPSYTWSVASGTLPAGLSLSTGAITGTPTTAGTWSFTLRVTDSASPAATTTQGLSITISAAATAITIWPSTALPGTADSGPDSAVELGVKFRSDVAGTITGIRFYKGSGNTGTHVGNLWSSSGTKLASVTFSGETTSGWQQANFSTPLSITANTVYVASYNTTVGHYADDQNYFATTGVDNPPLHALQNGVSGGNGVYAYGSTSSFPNQTWNTSNYWVDVVFVPSSGTQQTLALTQSASTQISVAGVSTPAGDVQQTPDAVTAAQALSVHGAAG